MRISCGEFTSQMGREFSVPIYSKGYLVVPERRISVGKFALLLLFFLLYMRLKIALLLSAICLFANAQDTIETKDNNSTILSTGSEVSFAPSNNTSPADLEARINEINPYVLFRKGSVAEYKFQQDGKDFAYHGTLHYFQQIVSDTKIENGQLVAYVQQRFLNKKHNPIKGISREALQYMYPTEIDENGQFHLTHDVSKDLFMMESRKGYALMMPSTFETGQSIPSSSIVDVVGGSLGIRATMKKDYSNFTVEKMEQAITPAGTFDCVKITGDLHIEGAQQDGNEHYDMWIARGIGVVRLDITPISKGRNGKMYTIYLNHIDIK